MADRIYQDWEAKLKGLLDSVEKELEEVRAQKEALFSLNTDVQNKIEGRLIHDDRRLILSAPEIVIGNVNMGGTLDPAGGCTIIIRGNNVAVEGVGDAGSVAVRAPMISQTAENPGIDGKEHTVEGMSQVIIQGREVSIDSNDIPAGGAFLDARGVDGGSGIALHADKRMSLSATSSKKSLTARLEEKIKSLKAAKEPLKKEAQKDLDNFKKQGEELSKFNDKRDKLRLIDEDELTSSYHDIDELNVLISDLTPQLVAELYRQSKSLGELAELNRQEKFFTKMKDEVGKTSDDDFKKKPVSSSMSIQSEYLNIVNADGDGNLRTDEGSGVTILSNRMKVEGVFDDKGSLDKGNRLTVNMKTIDLSTAGRSGVEKEEDGTLKAAKLPAEGDVIITSKNITMQAVNSEVKEGVFKENGLTPDGTINMRAMKIGLSTVNAKDVEVDKDGKITKATYTSEGDISILSKNVTMQSIDSKQEGEKIEETALTKDSKFSIRTEHFAMSATDKEGKATGTADINALKTSILSSDTDPKTGKAKDSAKGGKIAISAEKIENFGKEGASFTSDKNVEVLSKETALIQGEKTIEIKQDDSTHLSLTGSNSELSGKKNTLKGETTVNVLKSPSITGENVTVGTALKAPDLTVAVMVDKKDTSTSGSKLSGNLDGIKEEVKKVENIASMSNEDVNKQLPEMTKQKVTTSAKEEGFQNEEKKES